MKSLSKQTFMAGFNGYYAFTLAEVLITLGIIGVVAAMTMPTLINKSQDKILENQFKKSKTVIANGYKLMMAKNQTFKVPNLPIINECYSMRNSKCMNKYHKEAFNIANDTSKSLSADIMPREYAITGKTSKSSFRWEDVPYMFATTDGMVYGVLPDDALETFSVFADVNGVKNPNTVKKDMYKYRFSGEGRLADASDELDTTCSLDDSSGCLSQETCYALGTYHEYYVGYHAKNSSGQCMALYWNNWTNSCDISPTQDYYCR